MDGFVLWRGGTADEWTVEDTCSMVVRIKRGEEIFATFLGKRETMALVRESAIETAKEWARRCP